MKFVTDTHTHTLASGHAYSTLKEMVIAAQQKELELLAITDHAPAMPGGPGHLYFCNFRTIPKKFGSLELLMGAEVNIIDYNGTLDLDNDILSLLDLVIISLHPPCLEPGAMEQNTMAYLLAMENPYVSILGHPDDARYPIDQERVVFFAAKEKIILELNNSSLKPDSFRDGARQNDIALLELCKKYQVPITLSSDAHIEQEVANFYYNVPLLEEVNFPEELVLNTSACKFKEYLQLRRTLKNL